MNFPVQQQEHTMHSFYLCLQLFKENEGDQTKAVETQCASQTWSISHFVGSARFSQISTWWASSCLGIRWRALKGHAFSSSANFGWFWIKEKRHFCKQLWLWYNRTTVGKKKKKILPCRRQVQNLIVGIVNESITFHSKALSMYGNQKGALHEPSAKKGKHRM